MYSIVLPIKINHGNGFKIFRDLALKTYEKNLDIENLDYFYLVSPECDIQELVSITLNSNIPFRFISEESLLDPSLNAQGWFKQQLIKLLIATKIRTDHYLVLDSDIYLNQPLKYKDLFIEGKIKYNSEKWQCENNKFYSQNSNWWKGTCKVLDYDEEKLQSETHLMSVTPEVLSKSVVKELLDTLSDKHGMNWQQVICDYKFTEFTMYWVFLIQRGLTALYTDQGYPLWKHDLAKNILDHESLSTKMVQRSFTTPISYFSVIQGYLNIDVTPYIEEGVRCLDRPKIDAVFLTASMLRPNRRQAFSILERYIQTKGTVSSIKHNVPNSFCLLLEGSKLEKEEEEGFDKKYNKVLKFGEDPEIIPFVNNPTNIGHGECKLLEKGVQYLIENILPNYNPKYIIKLGGRYCLNDKFSLESFNPDKFTFREHYDDHAKVDVYTTGLYSIPVKWIELYDDILKKSQNVLSKKVNMVERMYHNMIPKELIHLVDTLGLQGELSYNRHFFSV